MISCSSTHVVPEDSIPYLRPSDTFSDNFFDMSPFHYWRDLHANFFHACIEPVQVLIKMQYEAISDLAVLKQGMTPTNHLITDEYAHVRWIYGKNVLINSRHYLWYRIENKMNKNTCT
jgi:hypothetical protein